MNLSSGSWLLVGAFALAGAGCYSVAPAAPPAAPVADLQAPSYIESYPSVVYKGRPNYFYADRWWYRDGDRWTAASPEPAELRIERARMEQQQQARWGYMAGNDAPKAN